MPNLYLCDDALKQLCYTKIKEYQAIDVIICDNTHDNNTIRKTIKNIHQTLFITTSYEKAQYFRNYFSNPQNLLYFENNESIDYAAINEILTTMRFGYLKLNAENTFVINLDKRADRMERMTQMLDFPFTRFSAIECDKSQGGGAMGCLLSHRKIIMDAKEKGLEYVFIMEDDCLFTCDEFAFESPPNKWDFIYFGGVCNKVYNDEHYIWKRISAWYTHCYIIHSRVYDEILTQIDALKGTKAVDEIYCEDIHPNTAAYMHYPILAVQEDDYSDIEGRQQDRGYKIMTFHDIIPKLNPNPVDAKYIYCLNLKSRVDKYDFMNNQFIENNLKVKFWQVEKNAENPALGCKTSHIEILKDAATRALPYVVILEDDAQLMSPLNYEFPVENWDMLYLGGNYLQIMRSKCVGAGAGAWYGVQSWSTYAYIVHNRLYYKLIDELGKTGKEIDKYYLENLHNSMDVYMHNPRFFVPAAQFSDSDVMGKNMDYSFLQNVWLFDDMPENEKGKRKEKGRRVLRDSNEVWNELKNMSSVNIGELPMITIVTPTMNRRDFFYLSLHNIKNMNYPMDRVQWVIIDEGAQPLRDDIPKYDFISYYYIDDTRRKQIYKSLCDNLVKRENGQEVTRSQYKARLEKKMHKMHRQGEKDDFYKKRLPIGLKRNLGVGLAKGEIIVHMDDDDYYPAGSVLKRVLLLQYYNKYYGIKCITCSTIPNFHIGKMISMINMPPTDLSYEKRVSEATMCYYKTFWEQKRFDSQCVNSEGEKFIRGRLDMVQDIGWNDIIVALLHNKNSTDRLLYTDEPNGWHFGKIEDELFTYLVNIGGHNKTTVVRN